MKLAVFKVFFDPHGKAERVQMLVSCGDKERDQRIHAYCHGLTIPIPRMGTKKAGQLWRQITFKSEFEI